MIPIIDRYIFQEVSKAFLGIVFFLLLVLVGNGYMRLLSEAVDGNIGQEVMLTLVFVETLKVLGPVTPPAFFLAILVTLGRMYQDSEVTALSAGGVGTFRLYRSVFLAAVPVTLAVAWLTMELQPWATGMKKEIFNQQKTTASLSSAVAGRFNEFSRGDLVFYVESTAEEGERLQRVFVQTRGKKQLGLITAEEGYQYLDPETGERFVVLTAGHRYEGQPGTGNYTIASFDKYSLRLDLPQGNEGRRHHHALPTAQLFQSDRLEHQVEFQYRLMLPLAVLVFTLISVPLSYSSPRSGMYGRLVLAILFYFTFVNMLALSGGWMESGLTPRWMGRWWVHLLMLALAGLFMLVRSPRFNRFLRRAR